MDYIPNVLEGILITNDGEVAATGEVILINGTDVLLINATDELEIN